MVFKYIEYLLKNNYVKKNTNILRRKSNEKTK